MLFAVDHGNSAIKTPNFSFASGLASYPVRPPIEPEVIEYDGTFWACSGQRISYMRDKTQDERFFILTLFAICKELERNGPLPPMVDVDLAVGLPPEHFGALKVKFADYFKRGRVQFVYRQTPVCLVIRQVMVYPQAYAAVIPRAETLAKMPRTFIVDIGGYTTDVLLLRNGRPDLQVCRSLPMGVITMCNDLIGRVSALHEITIEDDQIADIVQGRPSILPPEVQQMILSEVKNHAAATLDKLRELQVDLRATPAIFIGGGSLLFRSFLEGSPLVASADFVEDARANAVGYGMLGAAQLRKAPQTGGDRIAHG